MPKVRSNSHIHFFNSNNKNDGSLVIYPLKYARNKVFGIIGIDTMNESNKNVEFNEKELEFYQVRIYLNSWLKNSFRHSILCILIKVFWLFAIIVFRMIFFLIKKFLLKIFIWNNSKSNYNLNDQFIYFKGVASTFANAYANIIFKNRFIKSCTTAIEWLSNRCIGVRIGK